MRPYHYRRTALAVALAAAASTSQAQLQLEEVIVTATKRTESLQDVPISVSAVSGEKLKETGISTLEGMTAYVPNFSMNQSGISNNITIRGISSGINPGFEQSTGMYVDGIYYGRGQLSRIPLFDVQRIEVLRGPQPILFGKNSIAGAVSVISAPPSEEFEGSVSALYEFEEEEQDYRLVLSGPLSDQLAGRLSVLYRDVTGSYFNTFFDSEEKEKEESVLRGSLKWEPTDKLSILTKIEFAAFDDNGRNVEVDQSIVREDLPPGVGIDFVTALAGGVAQYNAGVDLGVVPGPKVDFSGEDGTLDRVRGGNGDFHDNESTSFLLNFDYLIGDLTLTGVTGYLEYEFQQLCDCDFTGASIFDALQDERFDQFSQEIRLTSPGGQTVDYIVGAFYQDSTLEFEDAIRVPTNSLLRALNTAFAGIDTSRFAEQNSEMWALFAQATWNVSDTLRLTVGARYTEEDKDATKRQVHFLGGQALPPVDPTGQTPNVLWAINPLFGAFNIEPYDTIEGQRSEDAFTPLVTVQWDATPDLMLYATYSEGFKAGGFDIRSNAHPDPAVVNAQNVLASPPVDLVGVFEFEEEEAENYEIGAKMSLGAAAELNAAIFATDYTDLQTSQFDGVLGFNVTNAGEVEVRGVELDGRWLAGQGLTLYGGLAYLDFEYVEFPNNQAWFGQLQLDPDADCNVANLTCDASGKRKEYTPEWKGNVGVDWFTRLSDALELRTTVDLLYTDEYNYNPTLDPRSIQDSFWYLNARVALAAADGRWEVAVQGRNLGDEDVVTYGGTVPLAGSLTGGTGMAYYKFLDRPRTIALQGSYRF